MGTLVVPLLARVDTDHHVVQIVQSDEHRPSAEPDPVKDHVSSTSRVTRAFCRLDVGSSLHDKQIQLLVPGAIERHLRLLTAGRAQTALDRLDEMLLETILADHAAHELIQHTQLERSGERRHGLAKLGLQNETRRTDGLVAALHADLRSDLLDIRLLLDARHGLPDLVPVAGDVDHVRRDQCLHP